MATIFDDEEHAANAINPLPVRLIGFDMAHWQRNRKSALELIRNEKRKKLNQAVMQRIAIALPLTAALVAIIYIYGGAL